MASLRSARDGGHPHPKPAAVETEAREVAAAGSTAHVPLSGVERAAPQHAGNSAV